jgi:hypothetical protein
MALQTFPDNTAVPAQSGNSGKYLTTDGSAASWGTLSTGSMTLLTSANLTNLTTYTFSSINQSYKMLFMEFVNCNYNTTETIKLCPNGIPANNAGIAYQTTASSSNLVTGANTAGGWTVGAAANNNPMNSQIWIYNYAATSKNVKNVASIFTRWNGSAQIAVNNFSWGGFQASSAGAYDGIINITSLKIDTSAGQFNSGTVNLYGVN